MQEKPYLIERAALEDAESINDVTHRAFLLYAHELTPDTPVKALSEDAAAVKDDIAHHHVFVARSEDGRVIGSIRICKLTNELAYIYRFGVDPDSNSTGIGSDLLEIAIEECARMGFEAIALHTNSKYFKLARYYYGKQFYVHSTTTDKGYIRALFIKELTGKLFDISPAYQK